MNTSQEARKIRQALRHMGKDVIRQAQSTGVPITYVEKSTNWMVEKRYIKLVDPNVSILSRFPFVTAGKTVRFREASIRRLGVRRGVGEVMFGDVEILHNDAEGLWMPAKTTWRADGVNLDRPGEWDLQPAETTTLQMGAIGASKTVHPIPNGTRIWFNEPGVGGPVRGYVRNSFDSCEGTIRYTITDKLLPPNEGFGLYVGTDWQSVALSLFDLIVQRNYVYVPRGLYPITASDE